MKKRKQIKVSVLAMLMMAVLSVGCSKDDDAQPQPVINKVPVISAQTFTVAENIADDVVIGTVVATDPEQASITFELIQNSNDLFELTGAGEISLVAGKKLDFETNATYTITVEVSDGTHKASAAITISLENVVEAFITTWKTTAANEEIIFQLNDELTYNFTIDWGDGTIETNVTTTPKHTYVEPGVHTVAVSGVLPAIRFENQSGGGGDEKEKNGGKGPVLNASKLQTIEQWGDNIWESFESAFFSCKNMTYNATDIPNLSKVTDLRFMFFGCTKFDGDINNWDVGTVTSMMGMFDSASSFNRDLDQWDVSNVTNMFDMFSNATAFNGNISTWDVSNVTNMAQMFIHASSFNGNISTWNVGKVESMRFMFFKATSFNADLSQWNVGKVKNMSTMFSDATSFNGDISQWDVSNVTDMIAMFNRASSFNGDVSTWNVSKVENMRIMFGEATAFNGDVSKWDVSNVTNMVRMFRGATSFTGDISEWDISKVKNMSYMLDGTKLSTATYDALLTKWAALPNLQSNVTFGVEGLVYCDAYAARSTLINDKNWTFTGDSSCPR